MIEFHHNPEEQQGDHSATVIVYTANQLCWASELGYYPLPAFAYLCAEEMWQMLLEKLGKPHGLEFEEYEATLESHLAAAGNLAAQMFPCDFPKQATAGETPANERPAGPLNR